MVPVPSAPAIGIVPASGSVIELMSHAPPSIGLASALMAAFGGAVISGNGIRMR